MQRISVGHWRTQGIDYLVFGADAPSRLDRDRGVVLAQLRRAANAAGLRADKAALAYVEHGRTRFYGTPDLVRYLAGRGLPGWNHTLTV